MKRYFRIITTVFLSWLMLLMNTGYAFAQQEEEKAPEWILSYAFTGFSIALGIVVIVRSSKRKDSIISEYERKRLQEEELKAAGRG